MKGDNEQKYISINWFLNWLFLCRLISYLIMFCLQVNSVKKCKNAKWKNDSGISIPTTCLFKGPTRTFFSLAVHKLNTSQLLKQN